jgi:superfamily I DNA/RNA helicase
VIFPNLTSKDLKLVQQYATKKPLFRWLDKGWIDDRKLGVWNRLFGRKPPDDKALHVLREQFTPEVVIPASFVARLPRHRRIDAELDTYLLDYDQESVLKTDLDLDVEGEMLSRDFRIQVVNGVTGSGKTLILLYRLRLLHAMFPAKKFLVLTHNRPLIREMRTRFSLLNLGDSKRVRWYTFMGWCQRNWPKHEQYNPISLPRRDALVRDIRAKYLGDSGITEGMLKGELDWVKDSGITKREEYLNADRRGRGFRLTQSQREQMFAAILAYQKHLIDGEAMDWWDVPRRMWHWIEEGEVKPPQYDVVMVDEAQFFAPIWFDIVQHLIRPETGYLFVAADPTQGFLRQGESWKSIAGLEVRGHTHQLRRSYRTTQAILACALTFYRQRLPNDEEDLVSPELEGMQRGKPPRLLRFDSPQDERARIVNEIARVVEQGMSLRHILVLLASWQGVEALQEALNQRLGRNTTKDPKDTPPGDFIRVTTINAGTGLESPIVFVTGIHEMFEQEGSLLLGEDERAELIHENTRKLYMAFTRAGQRLILTCVGGVPASLKAIAQQGLLEID